MPVNAYVLLTVEPQKTQDVLERLHVIQRAIVREVLGPYDVIVELEEDTVEDLTSVVQTKIRPVSGITNTTTCLWIESRNAHGGGE